MTVKSIIAKLERQQRDLKEIIAALRYLEAFGPHKAHHEFHLMTSRSVSSRKHGGALEAIKQRQLASYG
jgi:hypothetical protein